jgi:hypothetical protein
MPVLIKSYVSSSLVLLAYDWEKGQAQAGFAGFGIERTPGIAGAATSWLPSANGGPTHKCYSWDRFVDASDRGARFHYRVVPAVTGPQDAPEYLYSEAGEVDVMFP